MKNLLLFFWVLVVFSRCSHGHKAGSFSAQYTKQPLKEFADTITELPSGTAIDILAYSGGEVDKQSDGINYCEFIGMDKMKGDTVRILATVIDVEDAGTDGKPVLTPATTYDFDKGIRDATFREPTEDDKRMIALLPALQGGQPDLNKLNSTAGSAAVIEYVLIPQGEPFFARHYKTVVGILSFKQQPW